VTVRFVGEASRGHASICSSSIVVATSSHTTSFVVARPFGFVGGAFRSRAPVLFVVAATSSRTALSFLSQRPFGAARQFGFVGVAFRAACHLCSRHGDLGPRDAVVCRSGFSGPRDHSVLRALPFGAARRFSRRCGDLGPCDAIAFVVAAFRGRVTVQFCWRGHSGPRNVCSCRRGLFRAMRCCRSSKWPFGAARPFGFIGAASRGHVTSGFCHHDPFGPRDSIVCAAVWGRTQFVLVVAASSGPRTAVTLSTQPFGVAQPFVFVCTASRDRATLGFLSSQPLWGRTTLAFVIAAFSGRSTIWFRLRGLSGP